MNIDQKTEKAISELAALKNVTVDALLQDFAAREKEYLEQKQADLKALETMENGQTISHDDMLAHIQALRNTAQERL